MPTLQEGLWTTCLTLLLLAQVLTAASTAQGGNTTTRPETVLQPSAPSPSAQPPPGQAAGSAGDLQLQLQRLQEQRRLCAKCDCFALRADGALNATVRVSLDENLDDVKTPDATTPRSPRAAPPPTNQVLVINCTERLPAQELSQWSWPARLSAGEVVASEIWADFRAGDLSGVSRLPHLPFRLTRLSLADNHLRSVASRAFANLAALADLHLQDNLITDLPHDAFLGMGSLENLNLSSNSLGGRPLASDLFGHLTKLARVSFAHNQLAGDLNGDTLPWSSSVRVLDLSHNALTGVSAGAWNRLPNIRELDLSHNKVRHATPHAFQGLGALERLDVSWNALESLPRYALEGLAALHVLDLSHNAIATVPADTFAPLKALNKLDLSWNALGPSTLGGADGALLGALPAGLRLLDVSHNPLGRHDGGLEGQRDVGVALPDGLEELRLEGCGLHDFQARSWGGLRALRRLQLADNDVSVLSDLAHLGGALAELNASRNSLTRFPGAVLPRLRLLDLSHNQLERAPDLRTPRLQRLLLDGNPMEELRLAAPPALAHLSVQAMPQLRALPRRAVFLDHGDDDNNATGEAAADTACLSIVLRDNPVLAELHEDALSGLRLCQLDLSRNAISWLPPKLTNWTALRVLDLQGNPWKCSCRLQWMLDTVVRILYRTSPALLEDLRCGSPQGVAGRRMVHWFNHTGRALCDGELMDLRAAGTVTLKMSPATLIVIVSLGVAAIGLVVLGILAHRKYMSKRRARNRRL